MTYDFYVGLWENDEDDLKEELKRVENGKRTQRIRNAQEMLPRFFETRFSANWYSKIREISLFAKIYENSDEKELLKIGYNEYVLRHLSAENGVLGMNDDWALKIGDGSSIFGSIACPALLLPTRNSFLLSIKFVLQKPFISKDDEGFYIHDNPVSKEKVFKIPYIRASSWKGNLRWAFGKANELHEDDERILRVFGNKKGEEASENLRKGRLYIYPTFFDQISLDIINPHDRTTKTGKNPITLEVVPKGRRGDLHLLYVPFDKIGEDEREIKKEIETDLLFLCRAIRALLTEYGMSAKRTSGYGVAEMGETAFKSILLREYEKYSDFEELVSALSGKCREFVSRGVRLNE
jgi:CRISPR/Cas system CSM-associated protein Csm3 (group 7 of RAMP superfamily)